MKLCYVDGPFAYFTDQPLSTQWGDDWDDAPYEHNAGEPYQHHGERIVKLAWEGPFNPPSYPHLNSPYSVRDINLGPDRRPWLTPDSWAKNGEPIMAGDSPEEFTRKVRAAGGAVYVAVV